MHNWSAFLVLLTVNLLLYCSTNG
uniref:Uncharacterized protein n=1 Tax=Anguilla anguilla TaxID=7936 RepID=A0A0E9VSZ6_ANGAN